MLHYAIVFGLGLLLGHVLWWRPKLARAPKKPVSVQTKIETPTGTATIETTVNPDGSAGNEWFEIPCPPHCGLRNFTHTHKVHVEVSDFAWCKCSHQKAVHLADGCGICAECKAFELDTSLAPATASNFAARHGLTQGN